MLLSLLLAFAPALARGAPPCRVNVRADLAFGLYDVYSPIPLTTTGSIRLACPASPNPQITLSAGNSGAFLWRELRSGAERLRYNVYQNSSMTIVWGDGTDGSSIYTSSSGTATVTLYGRIPAGQDAAAGNYSDSLLATIFL